MFTLGLVYATSAIVVFFRDLTQIISIFLQVGIWLTPIMWDVNMLANYPWLIKLFKLNPMYYIVTGFHAGSRMVLESLGMDRILLDRNSSIVCTWFLDL